MEAFPVRDSASLPGAFCTVEEWKSALMTLQDGAFFELLRSVFGNIKTPFSKQRLLADLSAFLSRDEIRGNISRYIDGTDARLIAATASLGRPGQAELEDFFDGEISRDNLRDLLVNLEERFILFRFQGNLALNPVLEPVLAPFVADRSPVFPSVSMADLPDLSAAGLSGSFLNDRVLAALVSFAGEEGNLFKTPGGDQAESRGQGGPRGQGGAGFLRKKAGEAGKRIFPGLDLEAAVGGLYCLGLFTGNGKEDAVNGEKLAAFRELSPRDRLVYCAAGICRWKEGPGPDALSPHLSRGRIRFLVSLIHRFLDTLNPSRAYPRTTLRRYLGILPREGGVPGEDSLPAFDHLLGGLESAGLLRQVSDYWLAGPDGAAPDGALPDSAVPDGVTPDTPALAMDAPFSFVIYPGIAFADALELASFTLVREAGTAVRFELTRDSAVRGFDRGIGAGEMEKLLVRLSGNRLEETLLWNLRDWEKRYGEVSLYEGIVLSLSPERCYLAEAEPVASLVRRALAPGIFLLSGRGEGQGIEAAAKALRKLGVDIIAQYGSPLRPAEAGGASASWHSSAFPPVRSLAGAGKAVGHDGYAGHDEHEGPQGKDWRKTSPEDAEALKEQFRTALDRLGLPKAERDELSARIDRRLVLSESQLSGISVRYGKLEARGLDYVGKAMIAKQAIASRSLVELIWSGGASRIFGIPVALEKQKLESVLILEPSSRAEDPLSPGGGGENTGDNLLHIPLGKISLLRRIKKSIFEN
jgi:hypothetical protein